VIHQPPAPKRGAVVRRPAASKWVIAGAELALHLADEQLAAGLELTAQEHLRLRQLRRWVDQHRARDAAKALGEGKGILPENMDY